MDNWWNDSERARQVQSEKSFLSPGQTDLGIDPGPSRSDSGN